MVSAFFIRHKLNMGIFLKIENVLLGHQIGLWLNMSWYRVSFLFYCIEILRGVWVLEFNVIKKGVFKMLTPYLGAVHKLR